mgnify:CR=1 FL=1
MLAVSRKIHGWRQGLRGNFSSTQLRRRAVVPGAAVALEPDARTQAGGTIPLDVGNASLRATCPRCRCSGRPRRRRRRCRRRPYHAAQKGLEPGSFALVQEVRTSLLGGAEREDSSHLSAI